jgi:hypothetical protein
VPAYNDRRPLYRIGTCKHGTTGMYLHIHLYTDYRVSTKTINPWRKKGEMIYRKKERVEEARVYDNGHANTPVLLRSIILSSSIYLKIFSYQGVTTPLIQQSTQSFLFVPFIWLASFQIGHPLALHCVHALELQGPHKA